MFRFYCSECKSVKRVQHKPNVIKDESLDNPTDRIGICDSHSRVYIPKVIKTNRVVSAESIKVNNKRKR